jgi:hypothetical protein
MERLSIQQQEPPTGGRRSYYYLGKWIPLTAPVTRRPLSISKKVVSAEVERIARRPKWYSKFESTSFRQQVINVREVASRAHWKSAFKSR